MSFLKWCSIYTFRAVFVMFMIVLISTHKTKAVEGNLVYLADANTGNQVALFDFGAGTINLQTLPENLTFVAFDLGDFAKSVVFYIDGIKVKTENFAPFAIAGDKSGNLNPYDIPVGTFTLSVEYYAERNGQGELVEADHIDFCVISLTDTPAIIFNSDQVVFEIEAGAQKNFVLDIELQETTDDYFVELGEFVQLPEWMQIGDPLVLGENSFSVDASNLLPGEYNIPVNFDLHLTANPCFIKYAFSLIRIRVNPSNRIFVSGFQMVNSTNSQPTCHLSEDFFPIAENVFTDDWYCLADSFSVVTETYGDAESVVIEYSYTALGKKTNLCNCIE